MKFNFGLKLTFLISIPCLEEKRKSDWISMGLRESRLKLISAIKTSGFDVNEFLLMESLSKVFFLP